MIKEPSAHGHRTIFPAVLVAAVVSLAFVGIVDAQSQRFQLGVIGDTSYSKVAEQEFDRLMAALNKENLAFVVHVDDFETDGRAYERSPEKLAKITMPCSDENFEAVLATFQKSANPFILTPGTTTGPIATSSRLANSILWNAWSRFARCSSRTDAA